MQRRFFIVRALGSVAVLTSLARPALARPKVGEERMAVVAVRRFAPTAAIPGGCGSHRRRSPFNGYTLADVAMR